MSRNELVAYLATILTFGATVTSVTVVWLKHRLARGGRGLPAMSDERLARIENAVEAMAIEVERISEGQRFTTRLLTERGAAHAEPPLLQTAGRGADTRPGGGL